MALRLVRAVALLLLGIYAGGVLFTVLAPSLATLPGEAYVPYWQALDADYGASMPVLVLSTVALLVVTCLLARRRGPAVWAPPAVALGLMIAVTIVTITQMEPLNALADGWNPAALPAGWVEVRDLWLSRHLVRTVLAVLAFGTLLVGHTLAPAQARDTRGPQHVPATAGA